MAHYLLLSLFVLSAEMKMLRRRLDGTNAVVATIRVATNERELRIANNCKQYRNSTHVNTAYRKGNSLEVPSSETAKSPLHPTNTILFP